MQKHEPTSNGHGEMLVVKGSEGHVVHARLLYLIPPLTHPQQQQQQQRQQQATTTFCLCEPGGSETVVLLVLRCQGIAGGFYRLSVGDGFSLVLELPNSLAG